MWKPVYAFKAVLVCVSLLPLAVRAEPVVLSSVFDPAVGPNEYVVQFPPELGGETVFMPIQGGEFELEVDDEAGTARIVSWTQDVAPIEIFGMSTGPIQISVDPEAASEGTYDKTASNSFSVSAVFVVEFDDTELRELGFESPFSMVGLEVGNIYQVGPQAQIQMSLQGEGEAAGSAFSYTCRTTARFDVEIGEGQAQPGDVNQDGALDISDPVGMLGSLFQGGNLACEAAAEVNGDDSFDLSDPVYLLGFLFQGGTPPAWNPVSCD